MSVVIGDIGTYEADAAMVKGRRVTINSSGQVTYAGADSVYIGTTTEATKLSNGVYLVNIRYRNSPGPVEMESAGAIVRGATVYGAASGKVDDASSGTAIGICLETITATAAWANILQF